MSTKFTCRFCKEQFDVPKGLYKHLQQAHNAGVSRDNRTCPICGVLCSKYEGYRDHLLYIHGQTDDGQKLTFKSLNEFLVWKAELELKHNCKYVLQTSPKVLPTKEKKYFYQCDRSDSKSKDKKSSVVMKTCSSVISVVEGTGVFKVEYWDTHSGHSEAPTVQPAQNELEAAISSVEMVNAIGDSDDSFDRSDDISMTDCTSPISNAEKQKLFSNVNTSANSNSINKSPTNKTKTFQSSIKFDSSKKKSTNTSVLYSLASVACGKGISKKTSKKLDESTKKPDESTKKPDENIKKPDEETKKTDENKNVDKPETELIKKSSNETPNQTTLSTFEEQSVDSTVTIVSESVTLPVESSSSSAITTTSTPLSVTTKTTSAPLATIAPKITTLTTNNISSLFTANSAFPNQVVIVNPVGMDQNSLSSNQNVFTAGQNILFSLGSLGQNIIPANTVSQSSNQVSAKAEKNLTPSSLKTDSSVKITTSNVITTTAKTSVNVSLNASNSIVTATSTIPSTTPITLAAGLNNAPVILSSLPVGSTFMSVNNNLIPIATPSGTFLPTNLPPNVVLTPVMAGTTASSTSGSLKSTVSGVTTLSEPTANVQTPVRYSTSSTVAITVSSIVKEPVYTTSTIKHLNNIAASNSSPVSSTASVKTYARGKIQSKPVSTLASIKSSPVKNDGKFMTSTTIKSNKNLKTNRKYNSSIVNEEEAAKIIAALTNKLGHNISVSKVNSTVPSTSLSAVDVVTVSSVPETSPKGSSARKRISRNNKSKSVASPLNNKPKSSISSVVSSVNSKFVSSPVNIAPKGATPNLMTSSQQPNAQRSGTLVFESSGEIYMLEPLENEPVVDTSSLRNVSSLATASKIKIERSVQTAESSCSTGFKSKLQRKRAAPLTDDSAVMLKVKCYQLEMKYLNIQTECKRLKVELTKERLKNAELTGKKLPVNLDEDVSSADSRNKAAEIMKEIEDKFSENKDVHIYTMTKTSVLRSLYEDLEELCLENSELHKELETYREHDKFYKSLKKKLYEEEF